MFCTASSRSFFRMLSRTRTLAISICFLLFSSSLALMTAAGVVSTAGVFCPAAPGEPPPPAAVAVVALASSPGALSGSLSSAMISATSLILPSVSVLTAAKTDMSGSMNPAAAPGATLGLDIRSLHSCARLALPTSSARSNREVISISCFATNVQDSPSSLSLPSEAELLSALPLAAGSGLSISST